ncbi:MAG: YeeE/YedE family protein [Gemmatimonas sp.]
MLTTFTPLAGLIGGVLIGLAAVALMAGIGRIAGVSGIIAGLIDPFPRDRVWRALFIAGLIGGAGIVRLTGWAQTPVVTASWPVLVIAGLLVGFGTRVGGGCTSGHGVCGLARFSPRSIVATVVFVTVAIVTVYLRRHVFG